MSIPIGIFPSFNYSVNIVISICTWAGTWWLLDCFTGKISGVDRDHLATSLPAAGLQLSAMVFTLGLMWYLKATISLCAGPLAISSDNPNNVFGAATLYASRLTNSTYKFFVTDQLLSMTVHLTVVLSWWSIWRLADHVEVNILSILTHSLHLQLWFSPVSNKVTSAFSPQRSFDCNLAFPFKPYCNVFSCMSGPILIHKQR